MTYKNYEISAEVKTYEFWTVDDDGSLGYFIGQNENPIDDDDILYCVENPDDGSSEGYFDTIDDAKAWIDEQAGRSDDGNR